MERHSIDSSTIAEVGYDVKTFTMEVAFLDGRVYQYFDVPEAVYDGLRGADSPGKFFHSQIRGVFRFARV